MQYRKMLKFNQKRNENNKTPFTNKMYFNKFLL